MSTRCFSFTQLRAALKPLGTILQRGSRDFREALYYGPRIPRHASLSGNRCRSSKLNIYIYILYIHHIYMYESNDNFNNSDYSGIITQQYVLVQYYKAFRQQDIWYIQYIHTRSWCTNSPLPIFNCKYFRPKFYTQNYFLHTFVTNFIISVISIQIWFDQTRLRNLI